VTVQTDIRRLERAIH